MSIEDKAAVVDFENPLSVSNFIKNKLTGGVWHVTKPSRFIKIQESGRLLPEPDIPDSQRWSTRGGRCSYPYARYLGGISLFDFPMNFDLDAYRDRCPMSSLEAFIPFPENWGEAIWLEISRASLGTEFIAGVDLWNRQKSEGAERHRLMPFIEAAHIGDLPLRYVSKAYRVDAEHTDWIEIPFQVTD